MADSKEINLLIEEIKKGSETAFETLSGLFEPLTQSMTEQFADTKTPGGAEREDLKQEASIALYRAALRYDTRQSAVTFGLYAKICMRNRLVSVRRHLERKKRKKPALSFSKNLSFRTESRTLPELSEKGLSETETAALKLYLTGLHYKEIAARLGCDTKSVDNALTRAKRKLKNPSKRGEEK